MEGTDDRNDVMDFHVITSTGAEHICSLVDGVLVIVPLPATEPNAQEFAPQSAIAG